MNATSLYVSTCRLVLQADMDDSSTWTDLYRLVPYLRQSMSCTVCGNLLIEPYTPTETNCQHHVCKSCKGMKKKLKPSCSWCKDYEKYVENVQLRMLLQCYKKLCEYVTSTAIYRSLFIAAATAASNGCAGGGPSNLMDLIQEGAGFKDDYKNISGLSKSAYQILPVPQTYIDTSTQTQTAVATIGSQDNSKMGSTESQTIRTVSNGSSLYSVMYPDSGKKITIKRKTLDLESETSDGPSIIGREYLTPQVNVTNFKKPLQRSNASTKLPVGVKGAAKRKGCRCGNATATPGKLTCCGQRCPCYVESKACMECKCRGCRNPHRPGGHKVRPHIPELQNLQIHLSSGPVMSAMSGLSNVDSLTPLETQHCLTDFNTSNTVQVLGVYTTQLHNVSSSLPAALLVGDDNIAAAESSGDETSDVDIDI